MAIRTPDAGSDEGSGFSVDDMVTIQGLRYRPEDVPKHAKVEDVEPELNREDDEDTKARQPQNKARRTRNK